MTTDNKRAAIQLLLSAAISATIVVKLSFSFAACDYSLDIFWIPGLFVAAFAGLRQDWFLPITGRAVNFPAAAINFGLYWLLIWMIFKCLWRRRTLE